MLLLILIYVPYKHTYIHHKYIHIWAIHTVMVLINMGHDTHKKFHIYYYSYGYMYQTNTHIYTINTYIIWVMVHIKKFVYTITHIDICTIQTHIYTP